MKKIMISLVTVLVIVSSQAFASSLNSIVLPSGGSITLGDNVVSCSSGPNDSSRPPSRYICSKNGISAEGSSIEAAFVQLQGMLSSGARCFDDMSESCMQSWCAQE